MERGRGEAIWIWGNSEKAAEVRGACVLCGEMMGFVFWGEGGVGEWSLFGRSEV